MSCSGIPFRMRAAVLEEFGQPYRLREVDTPTEPGDHDLLIRILSASYCHTDALLAEGKLNGQLPRVGCHEFAGRVLAMGSEVSSELGISIGDEVGVPGRAYHPCGSCDECTLNHGDAPGYSPYCPHAKNLGLTADGGFRDYALVDSRQVALIPSGMSAMEAAPLMCAGLTVWSALDLVKDAETVAIIGAGGGLGHLGVQFAASLGMKVIAVDAGEKATGFLQDLVARLASASAANAITIVDSRQKDAASVVQEIGGSGVEAVIVLPEVQAAFDYGMRLLKVHGTMVVVSFPEKIELSAKDIVFKDIRIVGSLVGRNYQLKAMLRFASDHGIRAVAKSFTLEHINDLVEEYLAQRGGKLVVDMVS